MKLYPKLFNKEVLGYNDIIETVNSEANSAMRYKTELAILKKVMKKELPENYNNYYLKNKSIDLLNDKQYCQVIASLENSGVILANDYKSGDEFDFFKLSAFYINNDHLKTFWEIEAMDYSHKLDCSVAVMLDILNEIAESNYWLDDFIPFFYEKDDFPWNYIIDNDFDDFYDEFNKRYGCCADADNVEALSECIIYISNEYNSIPNDNMKDMLTNDLYFENSGLFSADFSEIEILRYRLPILEDFKKSEISRDVNNELVKRVKYLIQFLDDDLCFYSRAVYSEDSCWAYFYENYDIRINIYLMEVDSVFKELNKKYSFSKIEPKSCKE